MIIEFWKTKENPITCYQSRPNKESSVKVPNKILKPKMRPVTVEFPNGEKQEHISVTDAALALKINSSTLSAILNGRGKQPAQYKVFKSKINQ